LRTTEAYKSQLSSTSSSTALTHAHMLTASDRKSVRASSADFSSSLASMGKEEKEIKIAVPKGVISTDNLACTTNFQNNCGLNALVHKIIKNLDRISLTALKCLYREFLNYYELDDQDLTYKQMKPLLKGMKSPIHREIILGLVLRLLLQKEVLTYKVPDEKFIRDTIGSGLLEAEHILLLAMKFGMSVESYQANNLIEDELKVIRDERIKEKGLISANLAVDTLTLFHRNNHWEYEEEAEKVKRHNGYYATNRIQPKGFKYDAGHHLEALKNAVQHAIKEINKIEHTLNIFESTATEDLTDQKGYALAQASYTSATSECKEIKTTNSNILVETKGESKEEKKDSAASPEQEHKELKNAFYDTALHRSEM
jgi:hypothetical protein